MKFELELFYIYDIKNNGAAKQRVWYFEIKHHTFYIQKGISFLVNIYIYIYLAQGLLMDYKYWNSYFSYLNI